MPVPNDNIEEVYENLVIYCDESAARATGNPIFLELFLGEDLSSLKCVSGFKKLV